MTDSLCILSHFPVEKLVCTAVWIINRIKTAGTDAAAASFAFVIVNDCFFIHIGNCIASAFFCTAVAATTDIRIDRRFSTGMLLHLSGAASASHTDIFQCTAKAVASWPLKWLRLIKISASMIAWPINAVLQYSPLTTGTSISSVPRSPSPMIIWHPVVMVLNPFRFAQSRCSRHFFCCPDITYCSLSGTEDLPALYRDLQPLSHNSDEETPCFPVRQNAF